MESWCAHDIRIGRNPELALPAADAALDTGIIKVPSDRVVHLGFETRVELTSLASGEEFAAQITRGDANAEPCDRRTDLRPRDGVPARDGGLMGEVTGVASDVCLSGPS